MHRFLFSDPPGAAFIVQDVGTVTKGDSISLTCDVSDPGRPAVDPDYGYVWQRGGHEVKYVTSANWTIEPVTLETEANISCVATNDVGRGEEDVIAIEVFGE